MSARRPPDRLLGLVSLVVRDYDEAKDFYIRVLGFVLVEDTPVPAQGKRWVVVKPPGPGGAGVLLARASTDSQLSSVGAQAGGRVFLFLYTDDIRRDYACFGARGVQFVREPEVQPHGTVAVFKDLYGNLWDLIQPAESNRSWQAVDPGTQKSIPVDLRRGALEGVMPIRGTSHLTFLARDLDRAARLFVEGLGAKEVYDSKDESFSLSREKFFLLGGVWIAYMAGEPVERSYRHVAFQVDEADLPAYEARLRALGVEIKPPRPRVEGEGQSLYFYDFDNNLFELHTGTLEQRLQRYARDAAVPDSVPAAHHSSQEPGDPSQS